MFFIWNWLGDWQDFFKWWRRVFFSKWIGYLEGLRISERWKPRWRTTEHTVPTLTVLHTHSLHKTIDLLRVTLEHINLHGRVAEVPQTKCCIFTRGHNKFLRRVRADIGQLLVMAWWDNKVNYVGISSSLASGHSLKTRSICVHSRLFLELTAKLFHKFELFLMNILYTTSSMK